MKKSTTYMRFLQLLKVIEETEMLEMLTPVEEQMIKVIAIANDRRQRLSVKDLMSMDAIASPATIHKNLKMMREKGWIFLKDTEDARRKQLCLTPQAMSHFDRIGKAIKRSIK